MTDKILTNRQAICVLDGLWSNPLFGETHRQAFEIGIKAIKALEQEPSVNSQPKTGHWVYKIYGEFHEQGDWHCSHCDYQFNYGNGHAKFCPECGYEMSEPSTEEVIGDRNYDWVVKR